MAVVVAGSLELGRIDFPCVRTDDLAEFLGTVAPVGCVLLKPLAMVFAAERRSDREVIREVHRVGLFDVTDRTGVSHTRPYGFGR